MSKADYSIETADGGRARLILKGQWVITELHGFAVRMRAQLNKIQHIEVDSSQLDSLDTAGALLLRTLIGDRIAGDLFKGQDKFAQVYELTETTSKEGVALDKDTGPKPTFWHNPLAGLMVRIGKAMETFWEHFIAQSVFIGHITTLFLLSVVNPRRIRWPALVNIMQRAGLEAIPIVTLTNFFVGIIRTPVFAATIAIVGCRMGMTVKEDVISLGRKVTTAVVQAIFLIFMIDAVFAILFNGFTF